MSQDKNGKKQQSSARDTRQHQPSYDPNDGIDGKPNDDGGANGRPPHDKTRRDDGNRTGSESNAS